MWRGREDHRLWLPNKHLPPDEWIRKPSLGALNFLCNSSDWLVTLGARASLVPDADLRLEDSSDRHFTCPSGGAPARPVHRNPHVLHIENSAPHHLVAPACCITLGSLMRQCALTYKYPLTAGKWSLYPHSDSANSFCLLFQGLHTLALRISAVACHAFSQAIRRIPRAGSDRTRVRQSLEARVEWRSGQYRTALSLWTTR